MGISHGRTVRPENGCGFPNGAQDLGEKAGKRTQVPPSRRSPMRQPPQPTELMHEALEGSQRRKGKTQAPGILGHNSLSAKEMGSGRIRKAS